VAGPKPRYLALAAMAAAFAWQWLTVHANYAGNWTALYCTGAKLGVPASLAPEHVFQFPDSYGYDGQMYHYIAHDPLLRTPDLEAAVDNPRLRYRRILVPGLAYLFAAGRARWVDPAFYAVILLCIGAGAWWSAALCRAMGRSTAWGLVFLVLPATLVSMDRMVTDVALAALTIAFAYYVRTPSWRLFVVLAAAILARETGVLLLAGYGGALLLERRIKQAAIYSLAALPALAWFAYVHAHTRGEHFHASFIPLSAIWTAFVHPFVYPAGVHLVWLAKMADDLALIGMLAAFALALRWNLRRNPDALALALIGFVSLGILLQQSEPWLNVYAYGRIYAPLLVLLGVQGLQRGSWLALVPLLAILPRIAMQFGNQILGVAQALLPAAATLLSPPGAAVWRQ